VSSRYTWIFDLDNTLHDAHSVIFPLLHRNMTAYLQAALALDEAQASALRSQYWKRYGATLTGMIRHHGTDPRHFLLATHKFPDLEGMVLRQPGLRRVIAGLPGRKLLFSNAPRHYTRSVLRILKISDLFDEIFAIEHTRYRPKPDCYGFLRLIKKRRLNPRRCIMVEDSLENLKTAKRLRMTTVWMSDSDKWPDYINYKIRSLAQLPRLAVVMNLRNG
jgi:putative hydrolase of the HAD superfamily